MYRCEDEQWSVLSLIAAPAWVLRLFGGGGGGLVEGRRASKRKVARIPRTGRVVADLRFFHSDWNAQVSADSGKVIQPFLADAGRRCAGGPAVRISNGCKQVKISKLSVLQGGYAASGRHKIGEPG